MRIIDAFRSGGRDGKPLFLQVQLGYAATEEAARRGAHQQWGALMLGSRALAELRTPADFAEAARFIRPGDVDDHVRVSCDVQRHIAWLRADAELGFDALYLHNVTRDQERFIDDFGARVLPALAAER